MIALSLAAKVATIDSSRFDDAVRGGCGSVARGSSLALPAWLAAILAFPNNPEFRRLEHCFSRSLVVGKKLYVGNLGYDVTNANLEELFAPFGSVRSAQVIQDRDTGRSKGFGFVEMADDNAARAAIQALNEKEHEGRPLAVNEARPREDRPRGGAAVVAAGGAVVATQADTADARPRLRCEVSCRLSAEPSCGAGRVVPANSSRRAIPKRTRSMAQKHRFNNQRNRRPVRHSQAAAPSAPRVIPERKPPVVYGKAFIVMEDESQVHVRVSTKGLGSPTR